MRLSLVFTFGSTHQASDGDLGAMKPCSQFDLSKVVDDKP